MPSLAVAVEANGTRLIVREDEGLLFKFFSSLPSVNRHALWLRIRRPAAFEL
jgi:hypothetical protein